MFHEKSYTFTRDIRKRLHGTHLSVIGQERVDSVAKRVGNSVKGNSKAQRPVEQSQFRVQCACQSVNQNNRATRVQRSQKDAVILQLQIFPGNSEDLLVFSKYQTLFEQLPPLRVPIDRLSAHDNL